jgi:hypothetical protein
VQRKSFIAAWQKCGREWQNLGQGAYLHNRIASPGLAADAAGQEHTVWGAQPVWCAGQFGPLFCQFAAVGHSRCSPMRMHLERALKRCLGHLILAKVFGLMDALRFA